MVARQVQWREYHLAQWEKQVLDIKVVFGLEFVIHSFRELNTFTLVTPSGQTDEALY